MSLAPLPCIVVFVADLRRITAFYRDVAAMATLHYDEDHAVLGMDNFQLVIHRLSGEPAVRTDVTGAVPVREDSYLKFCLPVTSIATARHTAATLGGAIKPPAFEWQARGFRACDGHDPEGNVFQVRESAASP